MVEKHKINKYCVGNCDETAVLFVPQIRATKAKKGTRRIRLITVGKEKPQITATILVGSDGTVAPPQLIFGGKTARSLPKGKIPEGWQLSFTDSHWQSEASYVEYFHKVIVPFKDKKIRELGLGEDSYYLLIDDLHYSHRSKAILAACEKHKVCMCYVPAACTDLMQVCDVVVNKPFKNATRGAFRDYIHGEFVAFTAQSKESAVLFSPKLSADR